MDVRELSDRHEIRAVLERYCRAVDRGDLDLLLSVYHPDATDDHGMYSGNGHEFAHWLLAQPGRAELVTQHRLTKQHGRARRRPGRRRDLLRRGAPQTGASGSGRPVRRPLSRPVGASGRCLADQRAGGRPRLERARDRRPGMERSGDLHVRRPGSGQSELPDPRRRCRAHNMIERTVDADMLSRLPDATMVG